MLLLAVTGHGDDQDSLVSRLGSNALGYLVSIHSRKANIQQDSVGVQRSRRLNRRLAIVRKMDLPSDGAKQHRCAVSNIVDVVDDRYARIGRRRDPARWRFQ